MKTTTKALKKRCDDLWAQAVRLRANNTCQRPNCPNCHNRPGEKFLQAHHIISRTNYALRHDIRNGVLLCRGSHNYWAHLNDPFIQQELMVFYETITDMAALRRRRGSQQKTDWQGVFLYLKGVVDEYQSDRAKSA